MAQETAKKISLKPIGNRVVAQRSEQEETTRGGIILPDSAKQKQETAVVVAIGNGKDISVAVGDVILMDKYASQEVKIDDEEFIVVKSEDIIAIVEK